MIGPRLGMVLLPQAGGRELAGLRCQDGGLPRDLSQPELAPPTGTKITVGLSACIIGADRNIPDPAVPLPRAEGVGS